MGSGTQVIETPTGLGTERWPIEVRALVTSLRLQTRYLESDRRRQSRKPYETQSVLWFKDSAGKPRDETVYTRDISKRMIALVCRTFLKPGQSVVLDLPTESGEAHRVQGHVRRCRQVGGEWCDCMVEFPKDAGIGR